MKVCTFRRICLATLVVLAWITSYFSIWKDVGLPAPAQHHAHTTKYIIPPATKMSSTLSTEFNSTTTIASSSVPWILNLRIQKAGSSSSEVFLKNWLSRRRHLTCPLGRSCKTIHREDAPNCWHWDHQRPACTCDEIQKLTLLNNETSGCRAINGPHMDFTDLTQWFEAANGCRTGEEVIPHITMTVLRDPLARVFSEYTMLRQHNKNNPYLRGWDYGCMAPDMVSFFNNSECRMGTQNRQTRMVAGHGSHRRWQEVYNHSPQDMLQRAKDNLLNKIEFGILEYWKESVQYLDFVLSGRQNLPGSAPVTWERRNFRRPVSDLMVTKLAEGLNSLDQELYAFAVDLFWKRFCAVFQNNEHCTTVSA